MSADAPLAVVPRKWRRVVVRPERVDRRGWEFCVLSEARAALRSSDLTVAGSRRFTPWDGNLEHYVKHTSQAIPAQDGSGLPGLMVSRHGGTRCSNPRCGRAYFY